MISKALEEYLKTGDKVNIRFADGEKQAEIL